MVLRLRGGPSSPSSPINQNKIKSNTIINESNNNLIFNFNIQDEIIERFKLLLEDKVIVFKKYTIKLNI